MKRFQPPFRNSNLDITDIARPRKREKISVASEKDQGYEKQPCQHDGEKVITIDIFCS